MKRAVALVLSSKARRQRDNKSSSSVTHHPVRYWLANDDPETFGDLTDLRRIVKLYVRALEPTPKAFGLDEGAKP